MKIKHFRYNGRQYNLLMLLIVPNFSFIINGAVFGWQFFLNLKIFLPAFLLSSVAGGIHFIICGFVATQLKKRFPEENQLFTRLSLMISTFLLIGGLYLYSLFKVYESTVIFNYSFNDTAFAWCYLSLGLLTIFLTFLLQGIANYKDWEASRKETRNLNETYKQSQLNGLKSQVNPHFLFNSLNSLSSLIQEDEEKAEKFLDEMSKVYRYMLRNDDEQLVTLETELKFASSYTYLLKERYGEGLKIKFAVMPDDTMKLLPPLALQVIIENTFSQNVIDKINPLIIDITTDGSGSMKVTNTIRPKKITNTMDFETGIDNLVKKYGLLNQPVTITDTEAHLRVITLPLINKKEEARV